MERGSGTIVVRDGASSVVIDTRAWPVVIATWFGEPTVLLVERYFEAHAGVVDRARKSNGKLVLITDTHATERPSPTARKRITDLTAAQPADVQTLTLRSLVVIENAMIRGVVTALAWIYPDLAASQNVASTSVALERAYEALDAARIPRPAGPAPHAYRRPPRP